MPFTLFNVGKPSMGFFSVAVLSLQASKKPRGGQEHTCVSLPTPSKPSNELREHLSPAPLRASQTVPPTTLAHSHAQEMWVKITPESGHWFGFLFWRAASLTHLVPDSQHSYQETRGKSVSSPFKKRIFFLDFFEEKELLFNHMSSLCVYWSWNCVVAHTRRRHMLKAVLFSLL